ncbi:hypothetical protein [Sutcliffiella sp. FSL R7-0096]|uniref:hypothetical protein n=1 Tax=Sutcliffiella sp. FSL R7-0096 TaxID=2921670 RepID=UPI003159C4AC
MKQAVLICGLFFFLGEAWRWGIPFEYVKVTITIGIVTMTIKLVTITPGKLTITIKIVTITP